LGSSVKEHTRTGFAALAPVDVVVVAAHDRVQLKPFAQVRMDLLDSRPLERSARDVWLIGEQDELKACSSETIQRGFDTR
jgi:hypothetical protein